MARFLERARRPARLLAADRAPLPALGRLGVPGGAAARDRRTQPVPARRRADGLLRWNPLALDVSNALVETGAVTAARAPRLARRDAGSRASPRSRTRTTSPSSACSCAGPGRTSASRAAACSPCSRTSRAITSTPTRSPRLRARGPAPRARARAARPLAPRPAAAAGALRAARDRQVRGRRPHALRPAPRGRPLRRPARSATPSASISSRRTCSRRWITRTRPPTSGWRSGSSGCSSGSTSPRPVTPRRTRGDERLRRRARRATPTRRRTRPPHRQLLLAAGRPDRDDVADAPSEQRAGERGRRTRSRAPPDRPRRRRRSGCRERRRRRSPRGPARRSGSPYRSAGGGATTALAIRCSSSVRRAACACDWAPGAAGTTARVQRRQLVAEGLEPARRDVVRHARRERRAPAQDRRLRRPVVLGERLGHAPL